MQMPTKAGSTGDFGATWRRGNESQSSLIISRDTGSVIAIGFNNQNDADDDHEPQ